MSTTFSCPCDGRVPAPPTNPPGLSAIAYRDATYGELRRAMLLPQPNETHLTAWRPGADGDLATMMVEWFAYLGDILTFYNERVANEDYLRTATKGANLRGLIQLLGYRPQPGIGATASIAALVQPGPNFGQATQLPPGMKVQSKPAPGQTPQTFELATVTPISAPDMVPGTAPLAMLSPNATLLLLDGTVRSIIGGANLLLRPRDGSAPALVTVSGVSSVTLPSGAKQTQLTVSLPNGAVPGSASAYRLEQTTLTAQLWSLGGSAIDSSGNLHLSGIVRSLKVGDQVVFTYDDVTFQRSHALLRRPGSAPIRIETVSGQMLGTITAIQDVIWDANGNVPSAPDPKDAATSVLVPHTQIKIQETLEFDSATGTTMFYNWVEAGRLLDQPVPTWPNGQFTLIPTTPAPFPPNASGASVLIADVTGAGVSATATTQSDGSLLVSGLPTPTPVLQTPVSVYFNVLPLTRGQTVPAEQLGTGNPTQANQSFTLAKSPLTYLRKGDAIVSQLAITVNGLAWTEVDNFFNQPANATVFVTSQDDNGITTVHFGDGVNGARPSGPIIARYRIGSGSAQPPAGSLTVIANPVPGLRALRNPVQAGGGADPDPPDQIRTYAPRSVLTFNRAVSAEDFEAIAASVANGNRVSAVWAWDGARQRGAVTIYVAGNQATITDVTNALAAAGDPNRPVNVVAAQPINVLIGMEVLVTPSVASADVQNGIASALADPATGLFSAGTMGIGQSVFDSQIIAATQPVPGVVAVAILAFVRLDTGWEQTLLHVPPEGTYFSLDPSSVSVVTKVSTNGG
jgi:Baseplate J-like protein